MRLSGDIILWAALIGGFYLLDENGFETRAIIGIGLVAMGINAINIKGIG